MGPLRRNHGVELLKLPVTVRPVRPQVKCPNMVQFVLLAADYDQQPSASAADRDLAVGLQYDLA